MKTATNEKPILFSGPMVQAILAGRKTQTRRPVTQPRKHVPPDYSDPEWTDPKIADEYEHVTATERTPPKWEVGTRLWVRETWAPIGDSGGVWYRAGVPEYRAGCRTGSIVGHDDRQGIPVPADIRWKPSIFMPRWASRLTLEITAVRVERLDQITEADAAAEGFEHDGWDTPLQRFRQLWDKLNAKRGYSWESNPFVYVVKFRVLEPNE